MSERICRRCGKNEAGNGYSITLTIDGLSDCVEIFKNGMQCAACAEGEFIQNFRSYVETGYISVENGVAEVSSLMYSEAADRIQNQLGGVFLGLRIFSRSRQNNWDIIAYGPIGMNPRLHDEYVYFTRKRDARAYANLNYKDTVYDWQICSYMEVISKNQVCSP